MKSNPNQWPPHDVEVLRSMWRTASALAIGNILGRTRNSVIGQVNRMRCKEGEDVWPRKSDKPYRIRILPLKKPKPAKPAKAPPPVKQLPKTLPERVKLLGLSASHNCMWENCSERRARGSYCAEHAAIVYLPREKRARL